LADGTHDWLGQPEVHAQKRGSPIGRFGCVFSISLQLYLMDIKQHSKPLADNYKNKQKNNMYLSI